MEITFLNHVMDELEKNNFNKKNESQAVILSFEVLEAEKPLETDSEEVIPETAESTIQSEFERFDQEINGDKIVEKNEDLQTFDETFDI